MQIKKLYLFVAIFIVGFMCDRAMGKSKHDALTCMMVHLTEDAKTIDIVDVGIGMPDDADCDTFAMTTVPGKLSYLFRVLDGKKKEISAVKVFMSTEFSAAADSGGRAMGQADLDRRIKLGLGKKAARPVSFQAVAPDGKVIFEAPFLKILADDFLTSSAIEIFVPALKMKELSDSYHAGKISPRDAISKVVSELKDCNTAVTDHKFKGACEATVRHGKYALNNL